MWALTVILSTGASAAGAVASIGAAGSGGSGDSGGSGGSTGSTGSAGAAGGNSHFRAVVLLDVRHGGYGDLLSLDGGSTGHLGYDTSGGGGNSGGSGGAGPLALMSEDGAGGGSGDAGYVRYGGFVQRLDAGDSIDILYLKGMEGDSSIPGKVCPAA